MHGLGVHTFVRVYAVIEKPLRLSAWSGSVLASLLKPLFGDNLIGVSPIIVNGSWVSGSPDKIVILRAGSLAEFSYLVRGFNVIGRGEKLRLGASVLSVAESSATYIYSLESIRGKAPELKPGSRVELRYSPTIFMFEGGRVLYPSPRRLLLSAARNLSEALGVDVGEEAGRAACGVELVEWRGGVSRFYIGSGRWVKAFHGDAVYRISRSLGEREVELISLLLVSASVFGVGKSRGIGFGRVGLGAA